LSINPLWSAQANGIVSGHGSEVATANDEIKISRRLPPDWVVVARGAGEAHVQVVQELGQVGFSCAGVVDAAQSQLGWEPILDRAPAVLDAPLGLGGSSLDVRNAQIFENASQMRREAFSGQFFLEAPVLIVANEDPGSVSVDSKRESILQEHAMEDGGIAMEIFMGSEGAGEESAGGIINCAHEGHLRTASL